MFKLEQFAYRYKNISNKYQLNRKISVIL